jgi:hypothetical protein
MNVHDISDTDVLRAAADSLSAIPMPGAPDTAKIITTGRARRRRQLTALSITGTAAVTVVALGLSGALGAPSHQPSSAAARQPAHPGHAQLAAWTVTRLAGGDISVTISQFKDPAGLQSTLRADGVPASVTFASQPNPACRPYLQDPERPRRSGRQLCSSRCSPSLTSSWGRRRQLVPRTWLKLVLRLHRHPRTGPSW